MVLVFSLYERKKSWLFTPTSVGCEIHHTVFSHTAKKPNTNIKRGKPLLIA